jgi:hypothetical protein
MRCHDCHRDIGVEYNYWVQDDVWPDPDPGLLCVACLEDRIGRRLRHEDFDLTVPLTLMGASLSATIRDRIGSIADAPAEVRAKTIEILSRRGLRQS